MIAHGALAELETLATGVRDLARFEPSAPERWLANHPRLVRQIELGEKSGVFVKDAMRTWRDVDHAATPCGRSALRLPGARDDGELVNQIERSAADWLSALACVGEVELVEAATAHFTARFARIAFDVELAEDAAAFAAATRAMEECKGALTLATGARERADLEARLSAARIVQTRVARRIVDERELGEVAASTDLLDAIVAALIGAAVPSACALGWLAYALDGNPVVAQLVRREVADANHVYLRAVLHETLRLFPPGWLIQRRATVATALGPARLARDASVLVCPFFLHRDARWWRDPTTFSPERFLAGGRLRIPSRTAYRPFGGGARMCAGASFAMNELVLLAAMLLHRYEVRVINASEIIAVPLISLRPSPGVRITVEAHRWA